MLYYNRIININSNNGSGEEVHTTQETIGCITLLFPTAIGISAPGGEIAEWFSEDYWGILIIKEIIRRGI